MKYKYEAIGHTYIDLNEFVPPYEGYTLYPRIQLEVSDANGNIITDTEMNKLSGETYIKAVITKFGGTSLSEDRNLCLFSITLKNNDDEYEIVAGKNYNEAIRNISKLLNIDVSEFEKGRDEHNDKVAIIKNKNYTLFINNDEASGNINTLILVNNNI